MKKLLLATCIATALAACSSDGGSNKSETVELTEEQKAAIEEAFNLPPEPDVDENNETVLGVDSNGDDVRDDIERQLTFKHHDEPAVLKAQIDRAKGYSELFRLVEADQGEISKEEYLSKIKKASFPRQCIIKYYGGARAALPVLRDLSDSMINTKERLIANHKISEKLSGSMVMRPSNEEITELCAKYLETK